MASPVSANYATQEALDQLASNLDARLGALTGMLDKMKRDIGTIHSDAGKLASKIGGLDTRFSNFVSTTNAGMLYTIHYYIDNESHAVNKLNT